MEKMKEIFRKNNVPPEGITIERQAVRGIIMSEQSLLMIRSGRNGDYKFPGGGINPSETHLQALAREIREECGATLRQLGTLFESVIEYDVPVEAEYDLFKMTSFYYFCQVDGSRSAQELEEYEQELEYIPVWVDIETALRNNKSISSTIDERKIPWLQREIYILERIQQQLFHAGRLSTKKNEHAADI